MGKTKKARMICLRLTEEAMAILERVMEKNGITRTTAIEIAVRKQYYYFESPCSIVIHGNKPDEK